MYRELRPPAGLDDHLECLWVVTPSAGPGLPTAADGGTMIVPDGCTDIMSFGHGVVVAGPDDRPVPFAGAADPIVGVRFRPARAQVLGARLGELRNERVALAELWGDEAAPLEDQLAGRTADDRLAVLVGAVARRLAAEPGPDPLVVEVVRRIGRGERPTVAALADDLGISERQLRRRSTDALGYGPTTFARIARFQRALVQVRAGDPLADVAATTGYADQAHLTREVRALAGRPPGAIARHAA